MTWLIIIAGAGVGGTLVLCGLIVGTLFGVTIATRTLREIVDSEDAK